MKKVVIALFAVTLTAHLVKAQYGTQYTPYPLSYSVGNGFATTAAPGYIVAGDVGAIAPSNNIGFGNINFYVFGAVNQFYQIYDNPGGCGGPLSQISGGLGVSLLQSSTGPAYVAAGAYLRGCYFVTLNASGIVTSSMLFPFAPSMPPGSAISKPVMAQDNSGDFFISGSFGQEMYVIKITNGGTVIWSNLYKSGSGIVPKDMLMNPYNPNNLIIVGAHTDLNMDVDGFLMEIDGGMGAVMNSGKYGTPSNTEYFSSITNGSFINGMNTAGFVIGGLNLSNPASGTAWVVKLDIAGNYIWNQTISSAQDPASGDVVDILERQNSSGIFEYYALARAASGMLVHKLDNNGMPFPSPNNDFSFNISNTNPTMANSLSYINGAGTYQGLCVVGQANLSPGSTVSHYAHAYFNGETNCSNNLSFCQTNIYTSARLPINPLITPGLNLCTNFLVTSYGGFSMSLWILCQGNMTSGSNARGTAITDAKEVTLDQLAELTAPHLSVYPNPSSDKVKIKLQGTLEEDLKLELFNLLGERVDTFQNINLKKNENNEIEIDLNALKLESGIYLITASHKGKLYQEKIMYTK